MSQDLESLAIIQVPVPARAFCRRSGEQKVFGGFVLAAPIKPGPDTLDEVWEVKVTFVRRLGHGSAASGLSLDQIMTDSFLSDPESLSR